MFFQFPGYAPRERNKTYNETCPRWFVELALFTYCRYFLFLFFYSMMKELNMIKKGNKKLIVVFAALFFVLPFFVLARSYGEQNKFFIDPDYDKSARESITATIKYVSANAYFYIEDNWFDNLNSEQKAQINKNLEELGKEFDTKIYPVLTETYGSEWRPGIDSDYRITILFHQTKENSAGYFRTGDEYPKIQMPQSNEREMIYLNVNFLGETMAKSYLAHEFTHLITFNQKDRRLEKEEDVWLNELRADYSPTLLGYDAEYLGTNLQNRMKQFREYSTDALVEWTGREEDYGVANVFAQYLVGHYGIEILKDSMSSSYVGMESLNYALKKNKINKDIAQIFIDWTVAVFVNDCSQKKEYCYQHEYLKSLKIVPSLIFLPSTQQSNLSLIYAVKEWSGHWYRIVGGQNGLKVEFAGLSETNFVVPYVIEKSNKIESIGFLSFDKSGKATIKLPDFGEEDQSFTLIPSISKSYSGFSDSQPFWRFSLDISTFENNNGDIPISQMTKEQLKAKITELMAQLNILIAELNKLKGTAVYSGVPSTFSFAKTLQQGMSSDDVKYLQIILNSSADTKIAASGVGSPGNETNYFGSLTKAAVIKFQNK